MILILTSLVVLAIQLRNADLAATLRNIRPGYVVLAVCWIAVSMLAAAYNLLGFAPARLRLAPTLLAQLAVSGLRMIAPSALSTPAVATRYLVRSGVPMPDALATVGAAQTAQLVVTAVIVGLLGLASGEGFAMGHLGTPLLIGGVALAFLLALVRGIARSNEHLRDAVTEAVRGLGTIAAHARQRPSMVAVGVLASAGLTITHVLAFAACVCAVGGHLSLLTLTTVYLAAASAGSLIPTPGGLGAVEAALIAGLTTAGLPLPIATAAALLSRLVAVWLPAVPGWLAVIVLRRRALL